MRSLAHQRSRFFRLAPAALLFGAAGCAPAMKSGPPPACPQTPAAAAPAVAPSAAPSAPASFAGKRPKLVVVIALDQFRADYLARFEAHFGDTGFKRLLREGASEQLGQRGVTDMLAISFGIRKKRPFSSKSVAAEWHCLRSNCMK